VYPDDETFLNPLSLLIPFSNEYFGEKVTKISLSSNKEGANNYTRK
jgi:hypothetical protein